MPRPCAYVCINTAKIISIEIHGNIKRQKQPHNFPEVVKFEVQIWPAKFLVPVDTVGKNEKKIAEYVKNQLKEDMMYDQISIKEYKDPFNGSLETHVSDQLSALRHCL